MSPTQSNKHAELRAASQFLPKDFVIVDGAFFFSVVAMGLEQERVLAQLRYQKSQKHLQKLSTSMAQEVVQRQCPHICFHSPTRDATVHGVPCTAVQHHYLPVHFFSTSPSPEDTVALAAHNFFRLLKDLPVSGMADNLGVSGSLLLGAHAASSDVDLVVYGRRNFQQCRTAVEAWLESGELQSLDDSQWQHVFERRGCSLSLEKFLWHERRKCNKFCYRQVRFDMTCVELPEPLAVQPGRKWKRGEFEAVVTDDDAAFDSPAVYRVKHPDIQVVVAHTPTYAGQARAGERIRVRGWLERCNGFNRVVVGTSREAEGELIEVLHR